MEWAEWFKELVKLVLDKDIRAFLHRCLNWPGREERELEKWARKFFGFPKSKSPPRQIEIVLPGVPRARERRLICLNYPRFDEELAPDDVYTAIRVHTLLRTLYPKAIIHVTCYTTFTPIGRSQKSLTVSIGGAATNDFSRKILKEQPYHYGKDGHTIVGPNDQKYDAELTLDNGNDEIIEKLSDFDNNDNERVEFKSDYANSILDILNEIQSSKDIKRAFETIKNLFQKPLPHKTSSRDILSNDLLDTIKRKCNELGISSNDLVNSIKKKCEELRSNINKDYAFVSRVEYDGEKAYDMVLSGCRAYGQLAFFYDLLKRSDFYKKILKPEKQEITKGSFQAILPIEVSDSQALTWIKKDTIVKAGSDALWK